VWFNGHFTKDPEQIGKVDGQTGAVSTFDLPIHPVLAAQGGPVPYEQRIAPNGTVWISELQGNRLIGFDPAGKQTRVVTLPTSWSGPRRFDIDPAGILWIPAYSANLLVRYDPAGDKFEEIPIPIARATPYIVRVDRATGDLWIGTSAADAALRLQPKTRRWSIVPLPSQGALVRHLVIDSRTHDAWLAYGASPGRIPARIARLQIVR